MARRKQFQPRPQPLKHKDEWKKYMSDTVKNRKQVTGVYHCRISKEKITILSSMEYFTKYNFKLIPGLPLYRLDNLETVE